MSAEVLGIIAPHPPIMVREVGGERAGVTVRSADAMHRAAEVLAEFDPDALVLMSPHAPVLRDAFVIDSSERISGDLGAFGAPTPHIVSPGDPALAAAIVEEAASDGISMMERGANPLLEEGHYDHGALVPLSFLDRRGRFPVVEISLSFLPLSAHRRLGEAIRRASQRLGRKVAFIASGDCSHRLTPDAPAGYSPRGAEFDAELARLLEHSDYSGLETLDFALIEAAGECGLRSIVTLGGFLEGTDARTRVLAYEGPWGVGYLTAVAASPGLLESLNTPPAGQKGGMPGHDGSELVTLARKAIDAYVRERRVIPAPEPAGILGDRHGAFVSLHRAGELRGCIGTILPTRDSLAEEIVMNAIHAATEDPRFPPLTQDELEDLDISVDVLQAPESATLEDLDPSCYGVIVSCDWRRGLLLPDLEGVDTVADQVSIACRKAGIEPGEHIHLERFRVDRFH